MTKDLILPGKELDDNPSTRLPVCLCLDTSYSMEGEPIDELQKGVHYFFDAIKKDEVARYSAEIAIVEFNSEAKVRLNFANIDHQQIPFLQANGITSMGEGVLLALDILETRKKKYSKKGVDYYQPWLVLMTDGQPTDETSQAVNRAQDLGRNKKLTLYPVAIGDKADKRILKEFSTLKDNIVLKIESEAYFREFFQWLSQSVTIASQSVPGEEVNLPDRPPSIKIEL